MPVTINGSNTPTAGGVVYGDGTNYASTAAGTSGQVLTSNGSSAPSWATPSTGALVFISSVTASNSATVSFTNIGSTYATYMVTFSGVVPATDNVRLRIRTSTNNGSSWDSGSTDYRYAYLSIASDTTLLSNGSGGEAFVEMQGSSLTNDANVNGLNGLFYLYTPSSARYTQYMWNTSHIDTSTRSVITNGSGVTLKIADVDAIQFYMGTGNIASGTFRLYGIKNS